jgi:hypothetical protein
MSTGSAFNDTIYSIQQRRYVAAGVHLCVIFCGTIQDFYTNVHCAFCCNYFTCPLIHSISRDTYSYFWSQVFSKLMLKRRRASSVILSAVKF